MAVPGLQVTRKRALLVSLLLLAACSKDSTHPSVKSCKSLFSKMRSCQLLTEGEDTCDSSRTAGDLGNCFTDCIATSACRDVEILICDIEQDVTPATADCFQQCRERFNFRCGDGELVSQDVVCNTRADCADGSDEMDCSYFVCADGTNLPAAFECDSEEDCAGGEDEANCPTFTCANGTTVPGDFKCDGEFDCADGTDEDGCPPTAVIICPDE